MSPRKRNRPPRQGQHLPALRRQIDRIDLRLLRLLNQRAALALRVGQLKRQRGLPVFDGHREEAILRQVVSANHGPLSARAVQRVFQAILRECRHQERDGKRLKNRPQSIVHSP